MIKRYVLFICSALVLFAPIQFANAAISGVTNIEITLLPGERGLALIDEIIEFDSHTIGSKEPSYSSPFSLLVSDFSGSHEGWTVNARMTDFIDSEGRGISDFGSTLSVRCGSIPITPVEVDNMHDDRSIDHISCLNNINQLAFDELFEVLTAAPTNFSTGDFMYRMNNEFITITHTEKIPSGYFEGSLIFEMSISP